MAEIPEEIEEELEEPLKVVEPTERKEPITPVEKTKTSNLEDDLKTQLTKTQKDDLTDSGATTLHKHDHGGMDGLDDNDHGAIYYTESEVDTLLENKLANVVEDTTPQLGGDLDMNSKGIDFPSTANVTDCKDEDDMASDSATMLATQQSIKKYVDDSAGIPDYSATAGMVIPLGAPVFLADDTSTEIAQLKWYDAGNGDGDVNIEKDNEAVGQSFVIAGSGTVDVTAVRLRVATNASPGDWKVSIQSDSSGEPDESDLGATATLTSGDAGSPAYLTFASAITLTRGTKYWLVITSLELEDATNYYQIRYQAPQAISGQACKLKGWASGTWDVSAITPLFELYSDTVVGQVYRTDARAAATVDSFLGFNTAAVNGGGTAAVTYLGIYTGLTGLTVNTVYYIDDDTYANEDWNTIKTSAGTVSKVAGRALLTTAIYIKSNNE